MSGGRLHPHADPDLDRILLDRGWVFADSRPRVSLYEWLPSYAGPCCGGVTYVVVDYSEGAKPEQQFLVWLISGQRQIHTSAEGLLANLDVV
jgi:hypothetical protein